MYRMVVPVLTVVGSKRLPSGCAKPCPWAEAGWPAECLAKRQARLKRSPSVCFAPLSWQRREARRVGTSSDPLRSEASPLGRGPPSPKGNVINLRKIPVVAPKRLPLGGEAVTAGDWR